MKSLGKIASYWTTVEETLVQLFNFERGEARQMIADLRLRLNASGSNTRSPQSFFYHAEPLYVAADLASTSRLSQDINPDLERRYEVIRKRISQAGQSRKNVGSASSDESARILVGAR